MDCGNSTHTEIVSHSSITYRTTKEQGTSNKETPDNQCTGKELQDTGLRIHNTLRAKHGACPLTLASDLIAFAQNKANHLVAKIDNIKDSSDETEVECVGVGENLYYGLNSDPDARVDVKQAVQSWYDEIRDYNFEKPGFSMTTGHFTQVVWRGSIEIGMAWAKSLDGSYYVVAKYRPPGNVFNERFEVNVVPNS